MIKKINILSLIFFIGYNIGFTQENIMCSELRTLIKIENSSDLPVVINNNDGTILLMFNQQYITDIFNNYDIIDFYQAFPDGSESLQKFYYLKHYSKDIIVDLRNNVSESILSLDEVTTSLISQDLIDALDGVTFDLTKHVTDTGNCTNEIGIIDCPYIDIPEDLNISLTFHYLPSIDSFHVESTQLSPCGNYFSTYLRGGDPADTDFNTSDYSLQTWENELGTSTITSNSEPCYLIEQKLYGLLGVTCDYDYNYGNINISIDSDSGSVRLTRKMVLLGFEGIELNQSNTASVGDNNLETIRPYHTSNSPYLQISNFDNQIISIDIYNALGKVIYRTNRFEKNTINLSVYSQGLYFVKLSNSNNQQKVYKLILDY